jgi:hypothetical protein
MPTLFDMQRSAEETNAVELWRAAQVEVREVVQLFDAPITDEREQVFEILRRLRTATAAMQSLERLLISGPPQVG